MRIEISTIPKAELKPNTYYFGKCRNAQIALWDGEKFLHWRQKFGTTFIETIYHPEDDQVFDTFKPYEELRSYGVCPVVGPTGLSV